MFFLFLIIFKVYLFVMKVVEYDFDSNPNWVEVIANAMGGVIDGNRIKGIMISIKGCI
jgi:hypothetical protein